MSDLFDNKILCNKCEKVMKPVLISKNGFNLRAMKCEKCSEVIVHPSDKQEYEEFMRLKNKEYEVNLSMLEIYNEKVQDLLVPINKRLK